MRPLESEEPAPPRSRPPQNHNPHRNDNPEVVGLQAPCELCGSLTRSRAAYVPHANGRLLAIGVIRFPLCSDCGPQFALGTSAAVALVEDLRALALGGDRRTA